MDIDRISPHHFQRKLIARSSNRLKSKSIRLFNPGNKCYGKHFLLENILFFVGNVAVKMNMRIAQKGTDPIHIIPITDAAGIQCRESRTCDNVY